MNGLTVGRIVQYVFRGDDGKAPSVIRPATVTHIHDKEDGVVNLSVFLDQSDKGTPECGFPPNAIYQEGFVPFSSCGKKQRTWRFIPKA
jgi:hypothetical protein